MLQVVAGVEVCGRAAGVEWVVWSGVGGVEWAASLMYRRAGGQAWAVGNQLHRKWKS